MMNRLPILPLLVLTLLQFQRAHATPLRPQDLPAPILEMQQIYAKQGVCEKRWEDMATQAGIIAEDAGPGMKLYLVPCAQWAYNLGWTAFVTIEEPSHPDGFITKALRFMNYTPYEGLFGSELVYNIEWNSAKKTLNAQYFLNGVEFCGTRSFYQWSEGYQNLILKAFEKQDICTGTGGAWERLYPVPK